MFRIVSLFVLLMVGMSSFAQQKVTFSGVVRDAGSGETLIGALVALEKLSWRPAQITMVFIHCLHSRGRIGRS